MVGDGTRRVGGLGNRRRRPARCFDICLRRTVAQRTAWCGVEAHESGAGWSALRRLEQRSAAAREQRSTMRAEQSGGVRAVVAGRGETTSHMDRQRDGVTHGAAVACITRGVDVVAGQQHRREVVAAAMQLARARNGA
jgi:hypothetical protein